MKLVVNPHAGVPSDAIKEVDDDPFAAFTSETMQPSVHGAAAKQLMDWVRTWRAVPLAKAWRIASRFLLVMLAVALFSAGVIAVNTFGTEWLAQPSTGVLTVTSNPSGAEVFIDGARHGVTPLTTKIAAGFHTMTVRRDGVSKDVPITSKKNIELVQNIELGAPPPRVGALSIASDPPGLRVTLDGAPRGITPALLEELTPGRHVVTLAGKGGSVERPVVVAAGTTANLMVSLPRESPGKEFGSFAVDSPIEVQLFEGGALVGSSESARLYLPSGPHVITAVNEPLGFRRSMQVNVKPGEVAKVRVTIPDGVLSVNAQPWAEVILDGQSIGQTPIGNYTLPIGRHELVFRHPELGEHRSTIVVAVGHTARASVDLRK